MEKKIYEEPTIQKVEFDYKTRIATSGCNQVNVTAIDSSCHYD
jgi:hypothetical protein